LRSSARQFRLHEVRRTLDALRRGQP
jgi:hypothetical protein